MTLPADRSDPPRALPSSPRSGEPPGVDRRAFTFYDRLRRLDRFVAAHYDQPISLAAAASVAGLEATYFSAFFHDKTGVCFRDWLTGVRVDRAKELLRSANLPITQVARRVGFNHLSTFERAFKRCAGQTPRDYKRSVQPGNRANSEI